MSVVLLALLLPTSARAAEAVTPWLALTRDAEGFALTEPSEAEPVRDPVVAVKLDGLHPGPVRAAPGAPAQLTVGQPFTVSDHTSLWQLVPYLDPAASFWAERPLRLAVVHTDLQTGKRSTTVLPDAWSEAPTLRWAGDLDRDGTPDWLFTGPDDQLWLSEGDGWHSVDAGIYVPESPEVLADS